ncbi:23S rRNA (adenine(2503)-C(2))-methyltransferase RlmN [Flavobacteriales bacterium]|jgi:23S rRNA (adenine2503-C2)-methyltransferase|nr:23S rRNA (adenine(2503)-C(2))-methyltransferase RlmN [Flavobacteriales bacterium]MDB2368797.1 23S rRNA (adenine(2503)-C(2))-methyltransferase RlmN [Flavobacteriales bacterium]
MSLDKKNIRSLTLEELKDFFKQNNQPTFRAKQVYEWLWKKSVASFEEMRNISKEVILLLDQHFVIQHAKISESQKSNDRTIKSAFQLYDNTNVEGVLIPTKKRMTACISSQIGCSLTCKFCATGKLDRLRNLNADEIYDQVFMLNDQAMSNYNQKLSNIVYMGMGEPLLNYRNVLDSIEKITSEDGLGMSPKRITVSTAGIAKLIKKLGDDEVKFNLALSLHAANDKKRDYIMPINEQNSLESLKDAIIYFYEKTETRVTYEYIIFKDFNDELSDAQELADFAKIAPCKINIIEYNPIDDGEFKQAKREKVDAFVNYLESKNLIVNVRRSRGKDIDAACGQLANKLVKS